MAFKLGADINFDLLNYHFYDGFLFIHGRTISDSIATVQSYLTPYLAVIYYFLIMNFSPFIVNMVIATAQSFGIFLVFILSMMLLEKLELRIRIFCSFMISISVIFGPIFYSEIGGTMGDSLTAILIIASLILLIKFIDEAQKDKTNIRFAIIFLIFSASLNGIASAIKLTNAVYAVGISISLALILLLINKINFRKKIIYLSIFVIGILTSFILAYFPIGYMLWENFKNPVFPYFNNIFHSPYASFSSVQDMRWFPKDIWGYILMPFLFIFRQVQWQPDATKWIGMEIPFRTVLFAFFAILMPIYLFLESKNLFKYKKQMDFKILFLAFFFLFSYLIWLKTFCYYRYIIVLEMLAPLLVFLMFYKIFNRFNKKYFFAIFVFGISLLSLPLHNWGRINPYPNSYFGINKSAFSTYKSSLVIVGDAPMGFLLPYFPDDDRFMGLPVRIPATRAFMNKYLSTLKDWNGNIYYLTIHNPPDPVRFADLLRNYNLLLSYNDCNKIDTSVFPISICRLKKVEKVNQDTIKKLQVGYEKFLAEKAIKPFSTLLSSSQKFLSDGGDPSKLLPQYLEENGYLDKSFGYRTGPANNWTNNGGWIGQWTCPDNKGKCFGVGIVGNTNQLKPIIDKYKSQALQVFFPYPKLYNPNVKSGEGQLLMIFRAPKPNTIITKIPYTINFAASGNAQRFINTGFCNAEEWGWWSCAKEASISFKFKNEELKKPTYMNLKINALVSKNHPQTFEFYLNGKLIGSKTYTSNDKFPQTITLNISNIVQNENTLVIKVPNAASPKSLGINNDTRELGIGLISIEFTN